MPLRVWPACPPAEVSWIQWPLDDNISCGDKAIQSRATIKFVDTRCSCYSEGIILTTYGASSTRGQDKELPIVHFLLISAEWLESILLGCGSGWDGLIVLNWGQENSPQRSINFKIRFLNFRFHKIQNLNCRLDPSSSTGYKHILHVDQSNKPASHPVCLLACMLHTVANLCGSVINRRVNVLSGHISGTWSML